MGNALSMTLFLIGKNSGPNQVEFLSSNGRYFAPLADLDFLMKFDDLEMAQDHVKDGEKIIKVTVSADVTEFMDDEPSELYKGYVPC